MEKIELSDRMTQAVEQLNKGRCALNTEGEAEQGRKMVIEACDDILRLFREAEDSGDAEMMMLAKYFYTQQELLATDEDEPIAQDSCRTVIDRFDDAMLALEVVREKTAYYAVDKACPHGRYYRYRELPKDAFHVACSLDILRIKRSQLRPRLPQVERPLAQARVAMLAAAQEAYATLQREALPEKEENETITQ